MQVGLAKQAAPGAKKIGNNILKKKVLPELRRHRPTNGFRCRQSFQQNRGILLSDSPFSGKWHTSHSPCCLPWREGGQAD